MSRRDDTFILYYWEDYEEYETENSTCYYCLSESTIQIILNALRFVGWRTRWRLDRSDNNPRFPLGETWDKIESLGALAQKELLTDMSCELEAGFALLAEAIENASPNSGLEALAAAIAAQQTGGCNVSVNCCSGLGGRSGSGGAGGTPPPYSDVTPGNPATDPPPDGFEDWSEYNSHKCRMATYLVNTLIDDIGRASTINFNLQTVATLGVILIPLIVDPIPGDELIVLCGILIAIHEQAEQLLDDMASAMEERKDELICEFYKASNSATAETAFEAKWSEIWYDSPYVNTFYDWAAINSINTMVTSEMTNMLFESQTSLNLPSGDCTDCVCETLFTFDEDEQGFFIQSDNNTGSVLSWEDGRLRADYGGGTSPGAIIESSPVSHTIVEGDVFTWTADASGGYTMQAFMMLGETQVTLYVLGTGASGLSTIDIPLDDWIGETVTAWRVYTAKGGGSPWTMYHDNIGIACE